MIKKGFLSVGYDANTGNQKPFAKLVLWYVFVPIGIFGCLWNFDFRMDKDLNAAFVTFLSIFVVLVFQVIFIATDKFTSRYNDKWHELVRVSGDLKNPSFHETVTGYLTRLGNYTRLFVRQLVFILCLSIALIILSIVDKCYHGLQVNIVLSSTMMALFYLWFVYMLHAITSIYTLLMDDIEDKMNKL
jgi:hypothetical protein